MRKSPTTIAIEVAFGYTVPQRYSPSWSGSGLKLYQERNQTKHLPQMLAYDPAKGEDYSVYSVFCRNPATGALTLFSTPKMGLCRQGERQPVFLGKRQETPLSTLDEFSREYICSFDEWPWFDE